MNLKNQLKLYMDHHELSATQLANKSGVSKQVVSLWLSGGSPRKLDQVKKVAAIFETTIDHICYGDGLEKKETNFSDIPEDEWFTGAFEIKVRRLKR